MFEEISILNLDVKDRQALLMSLRQDAIYLANVLESLIGGTGVWFYIEALLWSSATTISHGVLLDDQHPSTLR